MGSPTLDALNGCAHVNSEVRDSRPSFIGHVLTVRRRRECLDCAYRWTTYEFSEEDYNAVVARGRRDARLLAKLKNVLGEVLRETTGDDPPASPAGDVPL